MGGSGTAYCQYPVRYGLSSLLRVLLNSADIIIQMRTLLQFILTFVLLATPVITAFFWQPPALQQGRVVRAQHNPAQRHYETGVQAIPSISVNRPNLGSL